MYSCSPSPFPYWSDCLPYVHTSINLTWVQPTGDMVESYIISYNFSINGCPGEDGADMIPLSDGTARQYTISGVEEDARYTISITAMNEAGSNNSASIMTTTPIAGRYYISSCDPYFYSNSHYYLYSSYFSSW